MVFLIEYLPIMLLTSPAMVTAGARRAGASAGAWKASVDEARARAMVAIDFITEE